MKLLEGQGLKKNYRSGQSSVEVLRGITLAVSAGDVVVIQGPSGAGKSTLLNLLGGIDQPSEGKVFFEGKDLYHLSESMRAGIRNHSFGFVFQFYHLVPELTALENIMLPSRMSNGIGRKSSSQTQAAKLLNEVGLSHRGAHRPSELSGGEQQRIAMARALINEPTLVFCDEPTGNLDSKTGGQILDLITRVNREQGTAFVIVTHENAVARIAGRTLSLKDGQI